jgi:hypothetical protein
MLFDLFQKVFLFERIVLVSVQIFSAHCVDEIAHFLKIVQKIYVLGLFYDFKGFTCLLVDDFFGFEDLHGTDKFFFEEIDVESF